MPTFVASSSMLRHSLLLNDNTSNNSNDVILNRLSILEDSINALNINKEATKPAGIATNTLSNSIDNSSNQRSPEELWSSVLLKNIPANGVCPVAKSEDVLTSAQNRSSHGITSNENNGSALAGDIDIVAYGVAKNVKATQLATFLESKGLKVVDCVLLTTYEQARSLSYKITIKAKDFEKSQDPATWPYSISFRLFIKRTVKITRQNESKSATTGQHFRQYNSNVQKRRYSSRQENSDRKWRYQSSRRNDNGITEEGNQVGSNKSSRSVHFDDSVVWLRPNQTELIL